MSIIKRVTAIHDLCGYGKCSLGTALPVLSAAGFEVCPVPTGIYSKHVGFSDPVIYDTSDMLDDYILSWANEDFIINAIYSGFLSNKQQISTILKLNKLYPMAFRFIDPVMGDCGKMYSTYTQELCNAVKQLVPNSDVLIPNVTEACLLLNIDYFNPNDKQAIDICKKIQNMGAKNIVLTGILDGNNIKNYVLDKFGKVTNSINEYIDYQVHGSGDLFSSLVLAEILKGKSVHESCNFASDFTSKAIQLTIKQPGFKERGISFEPLLKLL